VHLAEGQFLIEGLKLNIESEKPSRDSKTNSFQTGRKIFKTEVKLNKEQYIKVIPPLTYGMEF
jgi:hypothetical protein